jgi:EAL domain-containing protein (putative c-di-GMP-specific phosphodiesterase class I)
VRAVVGVAKAFGMNTVAEGVETCQQALCFRELGVSALQGFLFARPEPSMCSSPGLLRGGWPWDVARKQLASDPAALQLSVR